MTRNPKHRIVVRYGTIPLEQLIESAEFAAGCNRIVCDQEGDLAVSALGGADHTTALQAAELDGLEVDNAKNFLSD